MTDTDIAKLREALEDLSNRPGAPWREVDPVVADVIEGAEELLIIREAGRKDMNVMVTGSRDWRDIDIIRQALITVSEGHTPSACFLVNGCASGADAIARSLSIALGWGKPFDFWPDYNLYEFAEANKVRNLDMVAFKPDKILAFPINKVRSGTWHAINAAKRAGYVEGETLFLYGEHVEPLEDYPKDPYLWESGT